MIFHERSRLVAFEAFRLLENVLKSYSTRGIQPGDNHLYTFHELGNRTEVPVEDSELDIDQLSRRYLEPAVHGILYQLQKIGLTADSQIVFKRMNVDSRPRSAIAHTVDLGTGMSLLLTIDDRENLYLCDLIVCCAIAPLNDAPQKQSLETLAEHNASEAIA